MKFGAVNPENAEGGIVVHAVRHGAVVLKKGTVIGGADVAAMLAAGIRSVMVARLEAGDVGEDAAAAAIAAAAAGSGVVVDRAVTGRANLHSAVAGVLMVDKAAIDRLNEVDPGITVATLPAFAPVVAGTMIATAKIIPFAIPADACDRAVGEARAAAPMIRVAPYTVRKVAVISTLGPGLADKVVDKTLVVTAARLAPAGADIIAAPRVVHDRDALAHALAEVTRAGAELVIVFGASATTDRRDVIPAAIEAIGGEVRHFGMPVDPGNLLLVAAAHGVPLVGAPGCARSLKENGFDWVLRRLLCGLSVERRDITQMGVGGLLMEIATRPQPRETVHEHGHRASAVVPAGRRAGRAVDKRLPETT